MANKFSGDPDCCALWRFEDGALNTDSVGGNDLTNGFAGHPHADTSNFKEGSGSAYFNPANHEYLNCDDGSLDAGYPLKNGDATKKMSICFWYKAESWQAASTIIYYKGNSTLNTRSLYLAFDNSGIDDLMLSIGYNGGLSWETVNFGTACVTGRWYHVGITYQDSDKSYKIRIWDDTAGALLGGAEVTGNTANNINVENGALTISYGNADYDWMGWLDEMVVFNDILTSDEIDKIRQGTFGAGGVGEDGLMFGSDF